MKHDNPKSSILFCVIGMIPVIWLGLLIAPAIAGGLPEILKNLSEVISHPFQIKICEDSLKTVLIFLCAYGFGIGIYFATKRNYRRREEHGSAKWGAPSTVNKKYADKDKSQNKLLTQHISIGLDGRKHRRNLNVLVVGGSGSGKTRSYAKPNIMQCNTSFIITDP